MGSLSLLKFSILPSLWIYFVLQALWKCEAESTHGQVIPKRPSSVSWLVPKLSEKEKGKKGHHQNISVLKDQLTIESIVLGSDQCRPLWSMGWLNSNVECISVKMREAFPHTSWGCKESDTIQHSRCSCCCEFPRPELAFQPVPDSLWQVTSQFYFPLHKWG